MISFQFADCNNGMSSIILMNGFTYLCHCGTITLGVIVHTKKDNRLNVIMLN